MRALFDRTGRPPVARLATLLAPFALGIALEDRAELPPFVLAPLCLVACTLWGVAHAYAWRRASRAMELLFGVALGAFALAVRLAAPAPAVDSIAALTLLGAPTDQGSGCRVAAWVHGSVPARVTLHAPPQACVWLPGQRALAALRLAPLSGQSNPGGGDPRRRARRRGVRSTAVVVDGLAEPVGAAPRSLAAALERLRRRLAAAVDADPDGERVRPLLRALVIGDRQRLDPRVRGAFERSGTAHLLAVSGLHVGWVFGLTRIGVGRLLFLVPGLTVVRWAPRLALGAAVAAAGLYAALAGLGLPALRAAGMALAGALAALGGRPSSAWNALSLAALVVLAWEPAALFEARLWLSFLAVAGILIWRPSGGALARLIGCTLGASFATLPLAASLGLPFPVLGVVANGLAVPWFGTVVVPLALIAAVLGALVGGPIAGVDTLAVAAAELGVRLLERLQSPDLLEGWGERGRLAITLSAGMFALRLASRRAVRAPLARAVLSAGVVWTAVGLVSPSPGARSGDSILFLDVGHGDAALVRSAGRAWLIDAGPATGGFDAGRFRVAPALRAEGVARLDALVVTHADRDHIGGAASVLAAFPVGEVWLTPATWAAPAARGLRRVAAHKGVPIRLVAGGAVARAGHFRVEVLWPAAGSNAGASNDGSLVLRFEGPAGCALLSGDAPERVERALAPGLEPCGLLKLGHHGSRTSTSEPWLARLSPRVAVASAGRRTRGALPHPDVLARLRARRVALYETHRFGAVRVGFGPAGLVVSPFRSTAANGPTDR